VMIAGVVLFLLLPPATPTPAPTESRTPSASASPSPTATRTPTATPTPTTTPSASPTATPTQTPIEPTAPVTSPPPPNPDLAVFRDRVRPVLADANTGLRMLADMSGPDAAQVVAQLQQDGERLSDAAAPASIADQWNQRTNAYLQALTRLQGAYDSGSGAAVARDAAVAAERSLEKLVGI
jgi:hypothetical protein